MSRYVAGRRWLAGLLLLGFLLGTACSDEEPQDDAKKTSGKKTEPAAECLARSDVPPGVDPERAAVAVKVENDPAARPQSGLEDADVVFEEIVEGGITRFMAIYHCGESDLVGPVRSARFDDPKLALPFTNLIAFSGSNAIVGKELQKRGMRTLVEGMKGDAFFRIPPGSTSVHSVFVDTEKLRAFAPEKTGPPAPGIFPTGDIPAAATDARLVTINFEAENTIEYRWEKGAWHRYEAGEPFMANKDGQISVPNLLIHEVRVNNSKRIRDIEGNPSPELDLVGTGRAVLFRDGQAITGEWKISEEAEPPTYTTKDGEPFAFADGPVWVELVPSPKGQVKGSFSFK